MFVEPEWKSTDRPGKVFSSLTIILPGPNAFIRMKVQPVMRLSKE